MDVSRVLSIVSDIRYIQDNMYKSISEETGMNATAIEILMFFYTNPDYCTAKDLCNLKNIKPNLASFHIEKLVQNGYILRESVVGDRREVKLVVTEKSSEIIKKGTLIRDKIIHDIINGIAKEEMNAFARFMKQIGENAEIVKKKMNK